MVSGLSWNNMKVANAGKRHAVLAPHLRVERGAWPEGSDSRFVDNSMFWEGVIDELKKSAPNWLEVSADDYYVDEKFPDDRWEPLHTIPGTGYEATQFEGLLDDQMHFIGFGRPVAYVADRNLEKACKLIAQNSVEVADKSLAWKKNEEDMCVVANYIERVANAEARVLFHELKLDPLAMQALGLENAEEVVKIYTDNNFNEWLRKVPIYNICHQPLP